MPTTDTNRPRQPRPAVRRYYDAVLAGEVRRLAAQMRPDAPEARDDQTASPATRRLDRVNPSPRRRRAVRPGALATRVTPLVTTAA